MPNVQTQRRRDALTERCRKALLRFAKRQGYEVQRGPFHVFPRAFVVYRMRSGAISVALPMCDAEPQMLAKDKRGWWAGGPSGRQYGDSFSGKEFDPALETGDFCTTGYLVTTRGSFPVAIPAVP